MISLPQAMPALHALAGEPEYWSVKGEADIPNPVLRDLFHYWSWLRGARPSPVYTDLDPVAIPKWVLPHIILVEVMAPERFRVRLHGTEAVEQAGINLTGRYMHEVDGAEETVNRLSNLVHAKEPYYCQVGLTWSKYDFKTYEAVVLPLSDRSGLRVPRILAATVFS